MCAYAVIQQQRQFVPCTRSFGLSLSLCSSLLCIDDESPQYGCHLVLFILVDVGDHRSILLHLLNNERTDFNASSSSTSRHSFLKEQIFINFNKQNTSTNRIDLPFFLHRHSLFLRNNDKHFSSSSLMCVRFTSSI